MCSWYSSLYIQVTTTHPFKTHIHIQHQSSLYIHSTGSRASGSLMQTVYDFLIKSGQGNREARKSKEELWLSASPKLAKKKGNRSWWQVSEEEAAGFGVSRLISLPGGKNGIHQQHHIYCYYI